MTERLRGHPEQLTVLAPKDHLAPFGKRQDGTMKGAGYFGVLARTDDPEYVSTELSVGMTFDNQKLDVPLIVPTLTAEELAHLIDGGEPTLSIAQKARDHARLRLKAGKSPFAEEGEQGPLPTSARTEFREGYKTK